MVLGISTTKSAVVIAETKGAGDKFVIKAIRPIPFQVRSGTELTELLQSLIAQFHREGKGSIIALLKCSSGRFGSCLEAIKGEAMVELAAAQRGLRIVKVAPQSLKRALACAPDQKWRDRAGERFNPDGQRRNWSKGAAGAAAVAFKVAGGLTTANNCALNHPLHKHAPDSPVGNPQSRATKTARSVAVHRITNANRLTNLLRPPRE